MASGIAESHTNAEGTTQKQVGFWKKWLIYLASIELGHEPFLQCLDPRLRTTVVGAFAQA